MTTSAPRQDGDAEGLASALAALGVRGTVEAHGRLALLVAAVPPAALREPAGRRRAAALAEAHGFTHLALALGEEGGA